MKTFYGFLCILGLLLPYGFFLPWLVENGIDIRLFFAEAGQSRIGAFAWADVVISAIALIGFVLVEGTRVNMPRLWLPVAGTCAVGPSLGLPLFDGRSPAASRY